MLAAIPEALGEKDTREVMAGLVQLCSIGGAVERSSNQDAHLVAQERDGLDEHLQVSTSTRELHAASSPVGLASTIPALKEGEGLWE